MFVKNIIDKFRKFAASLFEAHKSIDKRYTKLISSNLHASKANRQGKIR